MLLSQSWNQGTVCADAPSWFGLDSWIICFERWHKGFLLHREGVVLHLNLKHMGKKTHDSQR